MRRAFVIACFVLASCGSQSPETSASASVTIVLPPPQQGAQPGFTVTRAGFVR